MNRRSFLQKSAISAAGLGLSPLFGGTYQSVYGQTAASNKAKVALIGCRSMGFSNLSKFLEYPEVECVALCDIDDEWLNKRAADVEKKTGKKVPHLYRIGATSSTTRISTLSLSVLPTTGTACRLSSPARLAKTCMSKNRFPTPSKNAT